MSIQAKKQALEALEMTIAFQDAATIDGYAEHSTIVAANVSADWSKVRRSITALRVAIEQAEKAEPVVVEVDLNKCPNCGGEADNGFDRCYPPNPYYCTNCMENLK